MSAIADARRVLFIRTDRLGETLLTLPAVAALGAALPSASLTLLVHPQLQPLLTGTPGVSEVLTHDARSHRLWWVRAWRLGRLLRSRGFDAAIVSNPMKELHLAVWLAGIPRRVGYGRKWGCCLSRRIPDRKALGERHEVEYNLDLVKALVGGSIPSPVPEWPLARVEHEQGEVLQLLERQGIQGSEPFIAVHPWASNPLKQWPTARYQELVRVLSQGLPVVPIGGPEEERLVLQVSPTDHPRVVDLVGRVSLRQLAELLRQARLLVSNDSGPVHLAAAVGTPTVVLFGASHAAAGPRRWGPWGNAHTVIWKRSLEEITVDEVVAAVEDTLRR